MTIQKDLEDVAKTLEGLSSRKGAEAMGDFLIDLASKVRTIMIQHMGLEEALLAVLDDLYEKKLLSGKAKRTILKEVLLKEHC